MDSSLDKFVIPVHSSETVVGDLSDEVFYDRIRLFLLLDRPVRQVLIYIFTASGYMQSVVVAWIYLNVIGGHDGS